MNETLKEGYTPGFVTERPSGSEKVTEFKSERVVIGSATFCDLRINQQSVSSIHAVVEFVDQQTPVLYDMGSETGTFVNGEKVIQKELAFGDEIKIGYTTIRFGISDGEKAAEKKVTSAVPPEAPLPSPQVEKTKPPLTEKRLSVEPVSETEIQGIVPPLAQGFRDSFSWVDPERPIKPIFTYPTPSQRALRVIMYWGQTPFEISHFVGKEAIVVGETEGVDFLLPRSLVGGDSTNFLVYRNGAYLLKILPSMKGVVRINGRIMDLSEAVHLSEEIEGEKRILLHDGDMAKILLQNVGFFMDFVPAPPTVKSNQLLSGDRDFLKILVFNLVLTLFILFGLSQVSPRIEVIPEKVPDRVATLIYEVKHPRAAPIPKRAKEEVKKEAPVAKVEPKKETPTSKKLKKVDYRQVKPKGSPVARKDKPAERRRGNEGAGARAAGKEGQRGSPSAGKDQVSMNQAERIGRGAPGGATKGTPGKSKVPGPGVADLMSPGIAGGISKLIAGGTAGLSGAGRQLRGYGDRTTKGAGGLGEVGTGPGGGGKSYGIGGLSTEGMGGGKSGTGKGAYGKGGNDFGGLVGSRGDIEVSLGVAEDVIILGSLDPSIIMRVLLRYINEIRFCYEEHIQGLTNVPSGMIPIRWEISPSGRVSRAAVDPNGLTLKLVPVQQCVLGVIKRIRFPEPKGGGIVEVTKSFSFRPSP